MEVYSEISLPLRLHKKHAKGGYKSNNSNNLDEIGANSWKQQKVNSNVTG